MLYIYWVNITHVNINSQAYSCTLSEYKVITLNIYTILKKKYYFQDISYVCKCIDGTVSIQYRSHNTTPDNVYIPATTTTLHIINLTYLYSIMFTELVCRRRVHMQAAHIKEICCTVKGTFFYFGRLRTNWGETNALL